MSRGSRRSSSADGSTDPHADDPPDDDRDGPIPDEPAGGSRGVRARLAVRDPPHAPVAEALPDGTVATGVERVRLDDAVVSEFRTERPIDADPVFAADGEYVYRIRSPPTEPYPCRSIESLGHPVSDVTVRTDPDRILLTLSLPTGDPIGDIVETVEATGASVTLERLTRSGASGDCDPVVVDRDRLTDRQREVVRTAHRLGYFEYPREADAEAVAAAVGIARSTFAEHLAAAQRRVFDELVDP
ncbi:helix-turn-helix domain-containing protein [Halorubrum sp. Ea8]|uniref:helix-turn-helix domain-containing protein n=1 Tax=Halorubrum sp. Ea8 TaxID=1383841 RepID=UPI000B99D300|nr:helix-turn-helix domain-containing protein [Halorubrum sp. Ea8]OYR50532.1 helix-turn-helix domain-containing protein [Halorubrum sp. Ea8]